jgi:hypothetical protein
MIDLEELQQPKPDLILGQDARESLSPETPLSCSGREKRATRLTVQTA